MSNEERLSEDYSDLKVKHQQLKDRCRHIYDYNNILIEENEKLKAQVKELESTQNVVIDKSEYIAQLEFALVSAGKLKTVQRITKGDYVKASSLNKAQGLADHFMNLYHETKTKLQQLQDEKVSA